VSDEVLTEQSAKSNCLLAYTPNNVDSPPSAWLTTVLFNLFGTLFAEPRAATHCKCLLYSELIQMDRNAISYFILLFHPLTYS